MKLRSREQRSPPTKPSGPFSDRPVAVFPVRVAQLAFVELAVGVARHRRDEVNGFGTLVFRNVLLAVGEKFLRELRRRRNTGSRLDDGLYLFTPVLVWNAEDGSVGDFRMR